MMFNFHGSLDVSFETSLSNPQPGSEDSSHLVIPSPGAHETLPFALLRLYMGLVCSLRWSTHTAHYLI